MTSQTASRQIDLFEHVAAAYTQPSEGRLTNDELYRMAAGRAGMAQSLLDEKTPIGKAAAQCSVVKRAIRWHQQSLRKLGLIQRVEGSRAVWELTETGRQKLRKAKDGIAVIGFIDIDAAGTSSMRSAGKPSA